MKRKNCVLVIEPDAESRRRVCTLLEEIGCETRVASSKDLREGMLWGCDVVLWAWDDWAAWVGLRETPVEHQLPIYPRVILVSRMPDECLWVHALRAGAFDYVEQPNSSHAMQEFRRAVASALGLLGEAPASAAA